MPVVKKIRQISFETIEKDKAISALMIYAYLSSKEGHRIKITPDIDNQHKKQVEQFEKTYGHSYDVTMMEIWKWFHYTSPEREKIYDIHDIYDSYVKCISRVENEPMKLAILSGKDFMNRTYLGDEWVFNGFVYEIKGFYSDEEIRLLILDDFDKERRYFEKLKIKFDETEKTEFAYKRPRIPESVRVEVWRRDGGKCGRCGSREKLEYDHIVPISKGGSNTARNIELLCEKCNRSKGNNVV